MDIVQKLDKLKNEFNKSVLIHLFPMAKNKDFFQGGYGLSGNTFSLNFALEELYDIYPEIKPDTNKFVHFTNIKALHSILNDISIRMYNLDNVNDPNEFKFMAKQFGYNDFQLDQKKKSIYIFSLCNSNILNSDDALTMWRLYGNEGLGCNIEFEINSDSLKYSSLKLGKIIYTELDFENFFIAAEEFKTKHNLQLDLRKLIKSPACLTKKKMYKTEQEYRLFIDDEVEEVVSKTISEKSNQKFDFNKTGEIVSYRNFDLYSSHKFETHIKINKIQLGFKYDEKQFQLLKVHIQKLFNGIRVKRGLVRFNVPTIELSPLKGEFY